MENLSTAARELYLAVVNDGGGYKARCAAARNPSPSARACAFVSEVNKVARAYRREHGTPPSDIFSTTDILTCTVEVADYYITHVAEA